MARPFPPELLAAARRAAVAACNTRLRRIGWTSEEIVRAIDAPEDVAPNLPALLLEECRKAHPGAVADMADAVAAGMHNVAAQTFAASFAIAGIAAANAYHQATRGPLPEAVPA